MVTTDLQKQLANLTPEQRDLALQKLRERKSGAAVVGDKNSVIVAAQRNGVAPLSFAQQRLWFLEQMEGASSYYNEFGVQRIIGRFDLSALQSSLNELVRRHEILRTTFPEKNGAPIQSIADAGAVQINTVDLTHLPERQVEREAMLLAEQESKRPFDLAIGPLLRVTVVKCRPERHWLMTNMHHIICDNWSSSVFNREIAELYSAYTQGRSSSLPPLPIQYADFAVWQRDALSESKREELLSYWKKQLEPLPAPLELPTDFGRPAKQTYDGENHPVTWERDLASAVADAGRRYGATPFMVYLAAYAVLLARYSCQEEIVIAAPIANRNRKELEPLIGFFVNTLLLKLDLRGNPTFEALIQRAQSVSSDAYAHQDMPLDQLIESLNLSRNTPLFRAMFIFQNSPQVKLQSPEIQIEPVEMSSDAVRSDLDFYLMEADGAMQGSLRYNRDLFTTATMATMANRLRLVLERYVLNPTTPLDDLQFESACMLPPIRKPAASIA
ncbi:MAG: condensation domain-containing protein [Candidatus Hinthialibacter antarcticus]|nr:condensation domain-containing protein [Candidatus Hinthialibacter antarcticus]